MKKNSVKIQKIALLGILGALALVLGFMESQLVPDIPFLPVGAKPGLSNIVTMFTACFAGFSGAIYITLIKVMFAFITRGATAALMSFCGGILSTFVLCLMVRFRNKNISFVGIGVLCAVAHNLGQLIAACAISGTVMLMNYGKYLLIFAIITGCVTGVIVNVVNPRLEKVIGKME
ncbi:MAG: Gx transporter family protein [Faecalibacterium sp.]|nr:Gx transporter family protein [Ruminococcus sp.]MCM1392324.1 Gx transporter family protein [Ruminococcus sp.]MCM1486051.1 Gx transporter family protein [Faecalibacterium sp.]